MNSCTKIKWANQLALGVVPILLMASGCQETLSEEPTAAPDWVIDQETLNTSVKGVQELLTSSVGESGGNLERDHVNLVFAFCTSHFTTDPAPAFAARALATELSQSMLVDGDSVASVTWELGIWGIEQGKLGRSLAYKRGTSNVGSIWPLTARSGSKGGHDTERAIVEITERLDHPRSSVVLLIANSAGTVGPEGYAALGSDSDEYKAALESWTRMPAVSKSGASRVVDYIATNQNGTRLSRKYDVVILVPKEWRSTGLVGATRSELLSQSEPENKPGNIGSLNPIPIVVVLALVTLGILAFVAARLLGGGKPVFIKVANRTENLSQIQNGNLVFRIVGPNLASPTERDVVVHGGPPTVIAEITRRDSRTVEVEPIGLALTRVGDATLNLSGTKFPIKILGETQLEFSGSATLGSGMAPRQFDVTVPLSMTKE